MRYLLAVPVMFGLAAPACLLQAQSLECVANDAECLGDALVLACGTKSDGTSCLAWIEEVETHALAQSPEWRLVAAVGYNRATRFSSLRDEAEVLRESARSIYRELIAEWIDGPHAAQAYVGLSSLAGDDDESIRLLRSAIQADPSDTNIPYLLAMKLQRRGEGTDFGEAADLYRATYLAWAGYYSAANALGLYARSGQTERAAEFRAEVATDSGMDTFPDEVVSSEFAQNLDHAKAVLATACQRYVISIFGPETCANGIDTLVAATRSNNSLPARRSVVDVATEGMRMLTISGNAIAEERRHEFGSILREWIATDAATAATFVLWSQHTESGLDESVSALERAVELAPDNGRYRYWLAHGYINQGRYDEAIEHFNLARDTIPDDFGFTSESIDRGIREAERARDTIR